MYCIEDLRLEQRLDELNQLKEVLFSVKMIDLSRISIEDKLKLESFFDEFPSTSSAEQEPIYY